MILFHGSKVAVEKPDIQHSRKHVDFAPGFYATPLYDQAKSLCRRFLALGQDAYISQYRLDDDLFQSDARMIQFDTYSDEWLNFVFACRTGKEETDYDVVIGGVANDKDFDTVELYFQGLIGKDEALGRFKYEKPNAQICFRSQSVIDQYLHYEGSGKL